MYINWQTNILTRTQTHKTLTQTGPFFRENLPNYTDEQHHPERQHQRKTHLPWISRELTRIQRRRNKSHKKGKQTGLNKHWETFRELRTQTPKALAISYKSYVNIQIGDRLKTNPKRFWSFIKANKRENIGIPTLRVDDKPITNDRNKAIALNSQFISVLTSERYPIPVIAPSLYCSMPPLDIGTNGIIKQLKNLSQNKATGPDELPARILMETTEQIAPIITTSSNSHTTQANYPTTGFKHWLPQSTKKSLKSDPANYIHMLLTKRYDTIQYNTIQYNTIQYNTIQYNTIQYNTIQYNTIQYNTIQYNTMQYNTMQCNAMQCNTIQYNTIQYNTMQCNTIQYNTIQCNTIQYDTIQYNTLQYNTIQYNAMQYNTIQYNTIQYNTIQYNIVYFQHRTQLHYNNNVYPTLGWLERGWTEE